MTNLRYGGPAPDFSLPSTGGGTVALAELKGRDVVLVFYCYDYGGI
jgi:peroxiredoxin Q/BCP